jgi:hypothetical protein
MLAGYDRTTNVDIGFGGLLLRSGTLLTHADVPVPGLVGVAIVLIGAALGRARRGRATDRARRPGAAMSDDPSRSRRTAARPRRR